MLWIINFNNFVEVRIILVIVMIDQHSHKDTFYLLQISLQIINLHVYKLFFF